MIQWKKNGEAIGPEWTRFKLVRGDRELRIKNVMSIDNGQYSCEAVNGFGVRVVEFTLVVYGQWRLSGCYLFVCSMTGVTAAAAAGCASVTGP